MIHFPSPPARSRFRASGIRATWALFVVAAVAWTSTPVRADEIAEHWYRVEMGGQPAGWMHNREIVRADERITESRTKMEMRRGGDVVTFAIDTRFVEDGEGKPLEAWTRQLLGANPIETTYRFEGSTVAIETRQGESTKRSREPRPEGSWLSPAAAQAVIRDHLQAGDERFVVRALDPQVGLTVVETTWVRDAGATSEGQGDAASRWRQTLDLTPGIESVVDLDAEGRIVRSTTPFMGTEMTLVRTSRAKALEAHGAPELLVQTLITPDRPIPGARDLVRGVFEVRHKGGVDFTLPSTGAQRAERLGDGAFRVTVAVDSSPRTDGPAPASYLRDSTFIDHDAPAVRRLVAEASSDLGETASDERKSEALRSFVGRYLAHKNLNSLLATSAEVAAQRAGDCTEHSVLLTAMLRGAGIPARVVTGLIYVDSFVGAREVFGYHMWSQAWIDGRWIDLDATLDRRFDAAHIAFATSALNDDGAALVDMAAIVPLIGSIDVRVVELGEPLEP